MRFHHEPKSAPQSGIARGIAGMVHKLTESKFRWHVKNINIRGNVPFFFSKGFFQTGHHGLVQVASQFTAQFIVLCEQVGEGVLVVCPIAYMVVHKHIGFNRMKDFRERFCVLGIHFNKIPVQVVVAGIAAKAIFQRAVLVGAGCGVSVQCTSNIVDGNGDQNRIFWTGKGSGGQISVKHHRGIDAIAFAWVYAIVDQYDRLFLSDVLVVEITIWVKGDHVQRVPAIGLSNSVDIDFGKFLGQGNIKIYGLLVSGSLHTIRFLKNGLEGGNLVLLLLFTGEQKNKGCKKD